MGESAGVVTSTEANSDPRGGDSPGRVARLLVIGAAAGAFSALFGVGGGVVLVPLLVMVLGYGIRAATATSLAAVAVIAAWGVATYGALGHIDWPLALLIGVPALVGVTIGVRVRAHLSSVVITRMFAVLLVAVAVLQLVRP